jgi:hypothetical protein
VLTLSATNKVLAFNIWGLMFVFFIWKFTSLIEFIAAIPFIVCILFHGISVCVAKLEFYAQVFPLLYVLQDKLLLVIILSCCFH